MQVCDPSGSFFGMCDCGEATGGATGTDTGVADASGSGGSGSDLCGNGFEDDGECEMGGAMYCPEDCNGVGDDTTGDTGNQGGCESLPTYVAMVPSMPSRWESGALVGFAAGQELCQMAAATAGAEMADTVTVCDYEQVVEAEMAGEFAGMAAGTTAWLHRTTPAMLDGVPTQPGTGGRCVDWIYQTNHIADGEFAEFTGGGAVNYNLDNDTFYDGVDTTHAQPGVLECGTQMRAILCCYPPCGSSS